MPEPVPQLRIRLEGNGRAVISWPNPSTGFHLETASSLAQPVQWIDQGELGTVVGNEKQVLVPTSAPALFFRLKKV